MPAAELPAHRGGGASRCRRAEAPGDRRYEAPSQTLLVAACPLPGADAGLAAGRGPGGPWRRRLLSALGLGVLPACLGRLGGAARPAAARLVAVAAAGRGGLAAADADLPRLERTGQRDLRPGGRRGQPAGAWRRRGRGARLAQAAAENERLASLGRVAAGVAHEIRNPLAAMRLKAENALGDGEPERGTARCGRCSVRSRASIRCSRDLLGAARGGTPLALRETRWERSSRAAPAVFASRPRP